MVKAIQHASIIFFPRFIFPAIMNDAGILSDPIQVDFLILEIGIVQKVHAITEIITQMVNELCFIAIQSGKNVLIGQCKISLTFFDKPEYLVGKDVYAILPN